VTRKRFSEFDLLHKLVKSSFSAKLNSATEFVMPAKPKKTWMKHFDDVSVRKTPLLSNLCFKTNHLTKTGSGQT
jgi:hypothetical protein